MRGAAVRAARRRAHADQRHRRRDLRRSPAWRSTFSSATPDSCRSGTARGLASAPTPPRLRSVTGSPGSIVWPALFALAFLLVASVLDRLSRAAPARRLLFAADAGVLGAHLRGGVPLDRIHRRRERPGRRDARESGSASISRIPGSTTRSSPRFGVCMRLRAVALSRFADRHRAARDSRKRAARAVRRLCDAALQADCATCSRRRSPAFAGVLFAFHHRFASGRSDRRSRSRASSSRW